MATRWTACSPRTSSRPSTCPGFDRSNVDGFAVQASDTFGAMEETPRTVRAQRRGACARHRASPDRHRGRATPIATGGMLPRGADAVLMVEHSELVDSADGRLARDQPPRHARARTSAMRAPTSQAARRCCARGSASPRARSACWPRSGSPKCPVFRRPRVAIFSTGNEIVAPGAPLAAGRRLRLQRGDHRRRRRGARRHAPCTWASFADNDAALRSGTCARRCNPTSSCSPAAHRRARAIFRIGGRAACAIPGIVAHGVALKPGKPICLAVTDGKPVVILPGFPDLGDLHVSRVRRAGDPRVRRLCRPSAGRR